MKFSEQWLRTWVNPPVSTGALADQLTMAGLEVEAVTAAAPPFAGVVVGRVIEVKDIENSDRLKACTVDIGAGEPLAIVTDAPVSAGLCTAVAPAGADLPEGKVESATLKGVTSQGRLCAGEDLGLAEGENTLLVFPEDSRPGTDLRELLQLDDTVIEIGITPNRGDCLSIAGIAREVAAVNAVPLSPHSVTAVAAAGEGTLAVDIDAPEACPRYVGRVITGIDPRARTPWWLRERLRRSGLRSVSPVVDVTNYVMLELGQPMHAFDLAKLDGGIRVRYAERGERVTLLNGQDLTL
ncbi:MAG TPA: phenylalanine--tRNA ligase subunit beta, partial [Gammaproteobacteria bacterium]|nr:phenylalanine--tRNA ligase subunit beta [Gammaproteobacteria bacterium]